MEFKSLINLFLLKIKIKLPRQYKKMYEISDFMENKKTKLTKIN